jgi:hypothetical protein
MAKDCLFFSYFCCVESGEPACMRNSPNINSNEAGTKTLQVSRSPVIDRRTEQASDEINVHTVVGVPEPGM